MSGWKERRRKREELNLVEQDIRRVLRTGMIDGTRLTIEFVSEFEGFGSYETWAQGWRITDYEQRDRHGRELVVMSEYLDVAVKRWLSKKEAEVRDGH